MSDDRATQINTLASAIEAATRDARRIARTVSEERFNLRPSSSEWSIAECLVHLIRTSEAYQPILEEGLQQSRRSTRRPGRSLRLGPIGWLLTRTMEPPVRRKFSTTEAFAPADETFPRDRTLESFESHQDELARLVVGAAGLPIDRVTIVSPFNARVKYNLFAGFHIVLAHQRRHLWQAEQVRSRLEGRSGQR